MTAPVAQTPRFHPCRASQLTAGSSANEMKSEMTRAPNRPLSRRKTYRRAMVPR